MWVPLKAALEQKFADVANKINNPSSSSFSLYFPCNSSQVQFFGCLAQPFFLIFPGEDRIWQVNRGPADAGSMEVIPAKECWHIFLT